VKRISTNPGPWPNGHDKVSMRTGTLIIPLPNRDFDPTEVAVPWKILRGAGYKVTFATEDGTRGYPDPVMITGEGLDPWGWIPGLRKIKWVGLFLRADRFGRRAFRELEQDPGFLNPKPYHALCVDDYDGLILPGGHAPMMRRYLESPVLQRFVADFFETVDETGNHKPVGAICHGVLLAARSVSAKTGKSVLHGRKTTALPWAFERSAWHLTRYFSRFWDPSYYRTYEELPGDPPGYWSVEHEVKRSLRDPKDFLDVPEGTDHYRLKTSGMARDRVTDSRPAWVVRDGNYISARWPGDVHTFAQTFLSVLT
jgi:putative intracellular protease/amidase